MTLFAILKLFFFIFGTLIGSFLNVVIYRLPLGLSVVTPRSSCPKCEHKISWYENIPVLSFLLLKGKCLKCKTRISIRYPLIEILVGVFSLLLAPNSLEISELTVYLYKFSVAVIFLAHFIIDIEHQLLPDKLNLFLLAIVLPFVFINYRIEYWLIGGGIGFLGTLGVSVLFYKIKGQIGLGGGDIKLFGILGLMLGPLGILNNIFLSCMLGAIVGILLILSKKMSKTSTLAFGPYIIIVAAIQIFFPEILESLAPVTFK